MSSRTKRPAHDAIPCDSAKVHPALREYFGYCFFKAALRLRLAIIEAIEKYGLELPPQLGILVILRSSELLNQVSLGEQLGVDKATMVRLIDGLEKLKLVERIADKGDRRSKLIRITPKGRQLSLDAQASARKAETAFLARLDPHERQVLMSAVPKLLQ